MKLLQMSSRALRHALILLSAGLISACISVMPGEKTPTRVWHELNDLRAEGTVAAPADQGGSAQGKTRTLLVGPVSSTAFCDGNMLAFSADGRTRAYYQFASWTDRPAKRLGVLVEKRLAAGGKFASVAQSTAGIRGELVLNLSLEQCFHDASGLPGKANLTFSAELIDWRSRKLIARRTFVGQAEVADANATAAVAGLSQALTDQLDELSAWIETSLRTAAGS